MGVLSLDPFFGIWKRLSSLTLFRTARSGIMKELRSEAPFRIQPLMGLVKTY
ncbi:hypothetical protein BDR06DRAFT_955398 [Suillus hirtellus]|nr:hypothetical protein BDR06DRAFT_955398 [Suillus hirtellus]